MKAIGKIEIENGLTLNNPTLEIKSVVYDWLSYGINVECYFKEENSTFTHSRTFTFENPEGAEKTSADILAMIKAHEVLGLFSE